MVYYQEFRIAYEVISAILCFILVWFMTKPYRFTRKGQYFGLPLAFGFLGASYLFSAICYAELIPSRGSILWLQIVVRTFAFIFLATTYYFSRKTDETGQLVWNITLSFIIVAILSSVVAIIFAPQLSFENYRAASAYVRIFIIISIIYVIFCTLRNHITKPNPASTVATPLGYILLSISQYSLIIWAAEASMIAWWGALGFRMGALVIFLFIAYRTFYRSKKEIGR